MNESQGWRLGKVALWLFPISQMITAQFLIGYAAAFGFPNWFYALVLGMVMFCVIADVLLFRAASAAEQRDYESEKARLLKDQAYAQRQYYERLSFELEEAMDARRKVLNTLHQMESMLSQGKVEQVREILHDSAWTPSLSEERFCQNRVVNALVSTKARICEEVGIIFSCNLFIPAKMSIPDVDLCAIFSNLIDNAINACKRVEKTKRAIQIRSTVASGVLVVKVENSCLPEKQMQAMDKSIKDEDAPSSWYVGVNESLFREHGWGLLILRDMAQRYNGSFEAGRIEGEKEKFHTSIMLVVPKEA